MIHIRGVLCYDRITGLNSDLQLVQGNLFLQPLPQNTLGTGVANAQELASPTQIAQTRSFPDLFIPKLHDFTLKRNLLHLWVHPRALLWSFRRHWFSASRLRRFSRSSFRKPGNNINSFLNYLSQISRQHRVLVQKRHDLSRLTPNVQHGLGFPKVPTLENFKEAFSLVHQSRAIGKNSWVIQHAGIHCRTRPRLNMCGSIPCCHLPACPPHCRKKTFRHLHHRPYTHLFSPQDAHGGCNRIP